MRMPRTFEHFTRRAGFNHFAFIQNRHPVSDRGDGPQVVRDEQDSHAGIAVQLA
jgi:hypothetical protein